MVSILRSNEKRNFGNRRTYLFPHKNGDSLLSVSTYAVKDRTWRSQPNQPNSLRPGPFAGSYECQLPTEARIELEEAFSSRFREAPHPPPKPRIRVRAVGRYIPEDLVPQEVVFLRPPPPVAAPRQVTEPPPPVLPLPPSVTPPVVRPAQNESRGGNGGWWALAILVMVTGLLSQFSGHQGAQPQSRPVEVRRALPTVEVRKALPLTSVASTIPQWGWQSIRMPDGEVVNVHYDGVLPSSAWLPSTGAYVGQEFSTGATSWVWMTARGANFPAWIDP
jgi:hypothetical protein